MTTLIEQVKKNIEAARQGFASLYLRVENLNGEDVIIRTSTHRGKKQNNNGTKCISFVTDSVKTAFGYEGISEEYVIDEDNYTDTYQTIEQVLEWDDIDPNTTNFMRERSF
jgi:hypothetical protein